MTRTTGKARRDPANLAAPALQSTLSAAFLEALPIALYQSDLTGLFPGPRYFGDALAVELGFTPEDFLEDRTLWMSRVHPDDVEAVRKHLLAVLAKGQSSIGYRWRCADNSERIFHDHAALTVDERAVPTKIVGLCLDISDHQSIEKPAWPSSFNPLSGPVAHDLNNMLMVAIWNLNLLDRTNWATKKGRERLRTTMEAAQNCRTLFRQMLKLTPQNAGQPDLLEERKLDTGRTALVVEGNATLRKILATQLSDLGYRALDAPSARPALDILRVQPVDLLFIDEPLSDGITTDILLRSANEIRPALKVISASDKPNSIKSDVFLPKPYQLVDFRHAVRSITFCKK